jgi:hypothetical protein
VLGSPISTPRKSTLKSVAEGLLERDAMRTEHQPMEESARG